jgi:hypothetical protein
MTTVASGRCTSLPMRLLNAPSRQRERMNIWWLEDLAQRACPRRVQGMLSQTTTQAIDQCLADTTFRIEVSEAGRRIRLETEPLAVI